MSDCHEGRCGRQTRDRVDVKLHRGDASSPSRPPRDSSLLRYKTFLRPPQTDTAVLRYRLLIVTNDTDTNCSAVYPSNTSTSKSLLPRVSLVGERLEELRTAFSGLVLA